MLMAQTKNGYIPPSIQRAMDQHMQRMPANLQKYQGGQTYIPAHMQEYITPYMHQQTTAGLNSLNPGTPRPVQARPPTPDLMRRDHSAFGEQFTVEIDPSLKSDTPRSLSLTPQYASQESSAPPAPPPYNPQQRESNPYDFLNEPTQKKSLFGGGDKKKHILVVAIGGVIVLAIIALIVALVFGGAPSNKEELLSIAKQQNELIRVADIGVQKSRDSQAKALAITTKLTLTTDQQPLLSALKSQKVKISTKDLTTGKDSKNDELLTAAEQANRFDEVFIELIQSKLTTYQKSLKAAYDNPATGKKLKSTLSEQYKNASLIINAKPEL